MTVNEPLPGEIAKRPAAGYNRGLNKMFSYRSVVRSLMPWSNPRQVFISCFPKSGSTYLYRLMHAVTGDRLVRPIQFFGHNEQDLFEFKLKENRHNCVIRLHTQAGNHNLALIKRYNIRPIVLVRNIFDILPSIYDHVQRDRVFTMGYIPRAYFDKPRDEQFTFLIRMVLPWYFNFLMSWDEAEKEVDCYWLTYERLFAEQKDVLAEVLAFANVQANAAQIDQAIAQMAHEDTNFNVGQRGRGQTLLTDEHVAAVWEMARLCPVNPKHLKAIGLDLETGP